MEFFIFSQMRKGNEEHETFQYGKSQSVTQIMKVVTIEDNIDSNLKE